MNLANLRKMYLNILISLRYNKVISFLFKKLRSINVFLF